jgi:coenzyme F420 hydrogenase subunit delta
MHNTIPLRVIVFGCGNVLLGDDGFGPEVIRRLQASTLFPDSVHMEDVGTGVREYLFDFVLDPDRAPGHLIILDAVDSKIHPPGTVFTITPAHIPAKKSHDFSLHQFPTVNLLQELSQHTGTCVHIIAAQVDHIPDKIAPGLSPLMKLAVKEAEKQVRQKITAILQPTGQGAGS